MANLKRSSRIQGEGIQSIASGGSLSISNKDHDNTMAQFVVSNEAASGSGYNIYICGTDGVEALCIFPQTVVTLETDSPFRVKNPSASSVNCTVGRVLLRGAGGGSAAADAASGGSNPNQGTGGVGATNTRFHVR